MQEVDAVAKACGLREFRYLSFAPVEFDCVPVARPAEAEEVALMAAPLVVTAQEPRPAVVPAVLLPMAAATQADMPISPPIALPVVVAKSGAEAAPPLRPVVVAADNLGPVADRGFSLLREMEAVPLPLVHMPVPSSPRHVRRAPRPASRVALAAARRT